MKPNSVNKSNNQSGVNSQARRNNDASFFNSDVGRRLFLKKTGMAGVATMVVGEVLKVDASADPGTGGWHRVLLSETFQWDASERSFADNGMGQNADEARADASSKLLTKIYKASVGEAPEPTANAPRIYYMDAEVPWNVTEAEGTDNCSWGSGANISFYFEPAVPIAGRFFVTGHATIHCGDTWTIQYNYPVGTPMQNPQGHQG